MSHRSQYSGHDTSSSSSSPSSSPEHKASSSYGPTPPQANVFVNDGSFLEMFKKYQQKQSEEEEVTKKDKNKRAASPTKQPAAPAASTSTSKPTPPIPMIGKRTGGKILPTGRVKKAKNEEDDDYSDVKPKDAWSVYMSEVKRYRETVCQSDDKTRPLVK